MQKMEIDIQEEPPSLQAEPLRLVQLGGETEPLQFVELTDRLISLKDLRGRQLSLRIPRQRFVSDRPA